MRWIRPKCGTSTNVYTPGESRIVLITYLLFMLHKINEAPISVTTIVRDQKEY